MSPPLNSSEIQETSTQFDFDDLENNSSLVNVDELIQHEEQNVQTLLTVTLKIAPAMFGSDGVKKSKNGGKKIKSFRIYFRFTFL